MVNMLGFIGHMVSSHLSTVAAKQPRTLYKQMGMAVFR